MNREHPIVQWRTPPGARADWAVGAGATAAEKAVIWAGSLIGVAVVAVLAWRGEPGDWSWWQYLLAALVAWDLFGGAVSNAASSTKRQYFGPDFAGSRGIGRVLRSPVVFTALHVYPLVIVALFPGGSWGWAVSAYALAVVGAVIVDLLVPRYLQRPVAMLVFGVALAISMGIGSPPGWEWFPAVYFAKLLLAHAVREEPYRPSAET